MRCALRLALGCAVGLTTLLSPDQVAAFVLGRGSAIAAGVARDRRDPSSRQRSAELRRDVSRLGASLSSRATPEMSSGLERSPTAEKYEVGEGSQGAQLAQICRSYDAPEVLL